MTKGEKKVKKVQFKLPLLIIASVIGIVLVGYVFIRPQIVRVYCWRQNDEQKQRTFSDLRNRQAKTLAVYNQRNLSNANLDKKAKDIEELNKIFDRQANQAQELLNQSYSECLHRW